MRRIRKLSDEKWRGSSRECDTEADHEASADEHARGLQTMSDVPSGIQDHQAHLRGRLDYSTANHNQSAEPDRRPTTKTVCDIGRERICGQ